jgi:hypothetical protein
LSALRRHWPPDSTSWSSHNLRIQSVKGMDH